MTSRKADASFLGRTPAFVSPEIGAAELCISIGTWDRLVADGYLPPPVPGLGSIRRWRWIDVEAKVAGMSPAEIALQRGPAGLASSIGAVLEEDDEAKRAAVAAVVKASEGFGRAMKRKRQPRS
ncbi:hypothetical protein GGR25_001099 [Kaistia hirudinis]|uniref:Uncharacterized protein n=1 Tax=Kaistia hirudinis TaxID=1293440 RepID=A0A840AIP9_9HYPH|nr:hypothetical protein [Kaistia hirudinis]MBB3930060.1 hypothetical protein [Kaistia hirudinis]